MYTLFRYPDVAGPMVSVATFQTADEVLIWWRQRPVDPDAQQHLLVHNSRVIAVESPKCRALVFV